MFNGGMFLVNNGSVVRSAFRRNISFGVPKVLMTGGTTVIFKATLKDMSLIDGYNTDYSKFVAIQL